MLFGNVKEIKAIKALKPYLDYYPRWALPVLIFLGILSSFSEGIGISLFIPFLESMSQTTSPQPAGNWLIDSLVNLFNTVRPESRLFIIALCIFISVLVKSSLSYGNNVLSTWLNMQASHRIRSAIFEKIMTVSFRFLEQCPPGKLLNALANETWRTSDALSVLISMIIGACTIVVYFTLLLLISWKLTILVTVAMIIISVIVRILTRRTSSLGEKVTRINTELANRMIQGIDGVKVIRAFVRESYEQTRFDQTSNGLSNVIVKLGIMHGVVSPVYQILSAALLIGVLFSTISNPEKISALLVFIFILYRLQPRIVTFDAARVSIVSLSPAVEEVTSLLDEPPKSSLPPGKVIFQDLQNAISFDNVTFCYNPPGEAAIQNISISIPSGKTTALVGHSGAGKSTLIKLILRFYDATEGEIYIDDYSLGSLNLESWRSKISLVSQDAYVFNTTVRENIAYGRLDATEEEITAAARHADAHNFISRLPRGYDTIVGERGVCLSGGQLQRITLARAIVRKASILILDEATNALDSISEQLIQDALKKLSQHCTVIVIAHRLSTIEHSDNIIVLNKGRVCEQGTFPELIKLDGHFARLYNNLNERNSEFYY